MEIPSDALTTFVSSQLGVALQIAAFLAVLLSGVKYLNKKLDERITQNVQKTIDPTVKELCKQIAEVKDAIQEYQNSRNVSQARFEEKTGTAITYINRALMTLQGIKEDEEIAEMGEQ